MAVLVLSTLGFSVKEYFESGGAGDAEKAMEDEKSKGYKKYLEIRKKNLHKMKPIPVCMMDDE